MKRIPSGRLLLAALGALAGAVAAMAADARGVWVVSCKGVAQRLDPVTLQPSQRTRPPDAPGTPILRLELGKSLWVADRSEGRLTKIHPATTAASGRR